MYTLYYMPGACSMAVHVVLNELGQDVKLENVSVPAGQSRSLEFLKINPRGSVPVLIDNGEVLREGGAILPYLLDKHSSPLLPKSGKERVNALEWLMFANATLHPAYARVFFILKNITDPTAKDQACKAAIDEINKLWAEINGQLAKTAYVAGDQCTVADVLISVMANWGNTFPYLITLGSNTKRMLQEVTSWPSYQQALQLEQVVYQAAG